jgi:Cft2 family RNA processing exonuclease
MKIEKYHLSAHADRQQLLSFAGRVKGFENVFVVHGEPTRSAELKEALKERYNAGHPELASVHAI